MARRESLRAEAARRGVTVSRIRSERGAELGLSPGQAVGHPRAGERLASQTPVGTFPIYAAGRIVEVDVTRREASRAGRYLALVKLLAAGDISPADFERRVARMAPIAGLKPEANPRTALALGVGTPPEARRVRYPRRRRAA